MSIFTDKAKELHGKLPPFLRELRKDLGLTMRALADRLGAPHSFVGKTETTTRRMDVAEFILYCEAMELEPRKVFDGLLKTLGK